MQKCIFKHTEKYFKHSIHFIAYKTMKLKVTTQVGQDYLSVKAGFTEDLFLALNPPFPPVKILRFDGCEKDDLVSLELNFILFKQVWESLITEGETTNQEFRFIDQGIKLPFFFKYWKHHHRVIDVDGASQIIDDIEYKTPFFLFDWLMWPALYFQFLYRKPVYKKYFKVAKNIRTKIKDERQKTKDF